MGPQDDRWMERWLPALRAAAADGGTVLELGCDTGGDTAWLVQQGFEVVAGDISETALRQCAARVPQAGLLRLDLRHALPFADQSFGAAVASLCLHYFDWPTTERAVAELRRCLTPGGLLLCRLNSINDLHHGAGQGEEIAPHYWRVHGTYSECKRFFDADDVRRLFADGWETVSAEELANQRYDKPKIAWEVVLRRRAA